MPGAWSGATKKARIAAARARARHYAAKKIARMFYKKKYGPWGAGAFKVYGRAPIPSYSKYKKSLAYFTRRRRR